MGPGEKVGDNARQKLECVDGVLSGHEQKSILRPSKTHEKGTKCVPVCLSRGGGEARGKALLHESGF